MKPGSLELVEKVMSIEEIFGTEIPDEYGGIIDSPSDMVDRFEAWLSNKLPNKDAAAFLKLAKEQQRPELAEDLMGHGGKSKSSQSSAKY